MPTIPFVLCVDGDDRVYVDDDVGEIQEVSVTDSMWSSYSMQILK